MTLDRDPAIISQLKPHPLREEIYGELHARPTPLLDVPLRASHLVFLTDLEEMAASHGPYDSRLADQHYARYLQGITVDHLRELSYVDRKALHNFKYFTWVEQQGRSVDELRELWDPEFWEQVFSNEVIDEWDRLIGAFNDATGLLGAGSEGGTA